MGQLAGGHHHLLESALVDAGMACHEADDALLHAYHIVEGLLDAHHHAGKADGMDGHGGSRRDEAAPGRHGDGHADGMTAAQHQGDCGLAHGGDDLGDGQPGFHVAAHRVQDHDQSLDLRALLHGHQLRDDVLIFGGFILRGHDQMAFHLADDGDDVDIGADAGQYELAEIIDIVSDLLPVRQLRVFGFGVRPLLRIELVEQLGI